MTLAPRVGLAARRVSEDSTSPLTPRRWSRKRLADPMRPDRSPGVSSAPRALAALLLVAVCFGGCRSERLADPPTPADFDALDLAEAEWVWKALQAIESHPDRYRPWANLCMTYQANGMIDLALACWEKVVAARPEQPRAWFQLARVQRQRDDLDGAIEAMSRCVELDPDYAPALARLDDWLLDRGDLAEQSWTVESDPWCAEVDLFLVSYGARLELAHDYRVNGQPETAILVLEEVRRRWPDDVTAATRLARAYLESERVGDGLALLESAATRHPDSFQVQLDLAGALEIAGESERALRHADRALALDPRSGPAHARKGQILRRTKRYEAAITSFSDAERLTPDVPRIPRAIGDCQARLQRWDEAAQSYERAMILDDGDPDLLGRAGFVYMKLERLDDAERTLARALELGPEQADAVQRMLEEVRRRRARTGSQP